MDALGEELEESIHDHMPLFWIELLGEVHRALHVGEQHGHLLALAFQGGLRGEDLLGEVLRGVGAGIALGTGPGRGDVSAAAVAELGAGRELGVAARAAHGQGSSAFEAEPRVSGILVTAGSALHRLPRTYSGRRHAPDFLFRLTPDEATRLRSQSVTSKSRGGRRYLPYAFTEQGVAMLSSVLRSPRAIAANIEIMRVFVKLREVTASHAHLARKLDELEKRYDAEFKVVFDAIRALTIPPAPRTRRVGFRTEP
jgi:hypothetical protein